MNSFSITVRFICFVVLGFLMAYTLFLMRSGKLNAHETVRWIVAEGISILMVFLWGMLPLISYTSALNDRELLVVLAVIFFGFIAYLILDSLVRISTHTRQIKILAQELALLRENVQAHSNVQSMQSPIEKRE